MTTRRETKSYPIAAIKAVDTEAGTFEAIVSVFGNVDYHGDRLNSKAFDGSLERWRASGDPIPVIFSHQWENLNAYLGEADPADVRALQPGDPELPEAIRELGGLLVKGSIDTDEADGRRALKQLKRRRIKEFSFAFDIYDEAKGADGFNDINEVELIEVGPTLKGANPLTQLIAAKSAATGKPVADTLADVAKALGVEPEEAAQLAGIEPPAAPTDRKSKAFVSLSGTVERLQEAILRSAVDWASELYGGNLYTVQLEGTFPTDSRAVIYVELWDDPVMGGRYFEATFEVDGDEVTLAEPAPVTLEVSLSAAKARAVAGVMSGIKTRATADSYQAVHDLALELGAKCSEAKAEEPPAGEVADPSQLLVSIDAELSELPGPE